VHDVRFFSFAIFFARPDIVIQFLVLKRELSPHAPETAKSYRTSSGEWSSPAGWPRAVSSRSCSLKRTGSQHLNQLLRFCACISFSENITLLLARLKVPGQANDLILIWAGEHIPSILDCLDPFGLVSQGDAGHSSADRLLFAPRPSRLGSFLHSSPAISYPGNQRA